MPINPPRKYSAAERAVGMVRSLDAYSLIIGWGAATLGYIIVTLVMGAQ